MIGWVTGTDRLTDPAVGAALADAGHPAVTGLVLGAAPALVPVAVGVSGAVRVVVGQGACLVLEANVDDLDPRVWPGVLAALLSAGAADAWLAPITMKKGRPAHTVCALVDGADADADAVRRVLLTETSTIGLRETAVAKVALARRAEVVRVGGQAIRVKVAGLQGRVVNVMPEWDDVAAAAVALGWPARRVLALATAAAAPLWDAPSP